jgi:hypothetical protein
MVLEVGVANGVSRAKDTLAHCNAGDPSPPRRC